MGMPIQEQRPLDMTPKETHIEIDTKEGKVKIDSDDNLFGLVAGIFIGIVLVFVLFRKMKK